jgi:hypothetical protein
MLKIDTVVLIDFRETKDLPAHIFNIENHKEWYNRCAKNLHKIMELTNIENMVYASYDSGYETKNGRTDDIFKEKTLFPEWINKKPAYDVHECPELFTNKNILLSGCSFYTCLTTRELGFPALLKNPKIKNVYSSPDITGYYGKGVRDDVDGLYKRTGQPLNVTPAKEEDFLNHENYNFEKIKLTENYNVFQCKLINSTK